MHRVIEPKILYFGTPVVLISTINEDGSPNLAPMSSAWWLDKSCMLGLGTRSQTFGNLRRTKECVLNLPSSEMVSAVDRLALTPVALITPCRRVVGASGDLSGCRRGIERKRKLLKKEKQK